MLSIFVSIFFFYNTMCYYRHIGTHQSFDKYFFIFFSLMSIIAHNYFVAFFVCLLFPSFSSYRHCFRSSSFHLLFTIFASKFSYNLYQLQLLGIHFFVIFSKQFFFLLSYSSYCFFFTVLSVLWWSDADHIRCLYFIFDNVHKYI